MYAGSIRSVERGAYAARTTSRRTLGILVDAPRQRCASHAAGRVGRLHALRGDCHSLQNSSRKRVARQVRAGKWNNHRGRHPRRPRRAGKKVVTKRMSKKSLYEQNHIWVVEMWCEMPMRRSYWNPTVGCGLDREQGRLKQRFPDDRFRLTKYRRSA